MEKEIAFFSKQQEEREKQWKIQVDEIKYIKHGWFNALREAFENDRDFISHYESERDAIIDDLEKAGFDRKEVKNYAAYQILVDGTVEYPLHGKIDFEGELSIKKYLNQKLKEHLLEISKRQEWQKEVDEIISLREEWFSLLKEEGFDELEINEKHKALSESIKKNLYKVGFDDNVVQLCAAFQAVRGSSPVYDFSPMIDIDGPLSIKNQLQQEIDSMQTESFQKVAI